jgi:hypothetical protein
MPTAMEVERLRLILSTYQDGSGQYQVSLLARRWAEGNHAKTLPGWRDFERTVAIAFTGVAPENKAIYDVLLPDPRRQGISFGISCKMKEALKSDVMNKGRAYIELTNAAGGLWDAVKFYGLNETNFETNPAVVGKALVETVEAQHQAVDVGAQGNVDGSGSLFLTLQYDLRSGDYQLFQFPVDLPSHEVIQWTAIPGRKNYRLVGTLPGKTHPILEWYAFSGGQLKYYPSIELATWQSERFKLEPLPEDTGHITLIKAADYFPLLWEQATEGFNVR